jgi:K+-transporting ATPase ATPase C chain
MIADLKIALRLALVTLVLCGLVYPLAITGAAQLAFPGRANGSLLTDEQGGVVGSELIAQGFARPAYLQPRPSAAGKAGWDALASGGSNLGATSKALRERVDADVARLRKENPEAAGPVPDELVTASGSGLDPHLSPAAARWQAPRIARARGIDTTRVVAVIDAYVEARDLGVLGEPRVDVLAVNLALDRQFGRPAAP